MRMKKHTQDLIAEVPRGCSKVGMTIGIDLGDIWSHYCTLNEEGEVVDRGRFRTNPSSVDKWFTDLPRVRIAMEAGTHSIWISEQLQELGHEVIVANVRELRAISQAIVRATRWMRRSWLALRGSIRKFSGPLRTAQSLSKRPSR
jgi:transposase